MGNTFKVQGRLQVAINQYKKALSIKPNYAEVHNNLGIALQEQGKLKEASYYYTKAITLRPNYADAAWNLSGTVKTIDEAKSWLEVCLKADPSYLNARIILSALNYYEGDKSDFKYLEKSATKDHPVMRSLTWIFNLPELPKLYFNRWALFDSVVKASKISRPFYEFGVWRGEAFRYLIKTFKKGYGFDTFEGIPEDWHEEKAGTYSSGGSIPTIDGGQFIVGKFENTLPEFFSTARPLASVINFDADLYSSTICALNHAKPVIDHYTILIFDEFINN